MFKKLFQTNDDVALLVLRLMLGIVFFPHGMQKLLGWFGGYGFKGQWDCLPESSASPRFFAFLAIMAEGLGSLGLITGLLTRVAAFGIAVNMAVAVYLLHFRTGSS